MGLMMRCESCKEIAEYHGKIDDGRSVCDKCLQEMRMAGTPH